MLLGVEQPDVLSWDVVPNSWWLCKAEVSSSSCNYLYHSSGAAGEWQRWIKPQESTELQRYVWFIEYSTWTVKKMGPRGGFDVWIQHGTWPCWKCLVFYPRWVEGSSWCSCTSCLPALFVAPELGTARNVMLGKTLNKAGFPNSK